MDTEVVHHQVPRDDVYLIEVGSVRRDQMPNLLNMSM